MCDVCGTIIGHRKGCPEAPEPEGERCVHCGELLENFDCCYAMDGGYFCEECFENWSDDIRRWL